ncbi:MAG: SEC-C domain-containing protein [Sedimentisphaerales bacterium]|nr:SEC-C domain-containing protein [Sedimentisphaerales bacterium]
MDSKLAVLPWDKLESTTGDIPWAALRAFADAVATDPEATRRLFDTFDRAYEDAFNQTTCADLYVPAIFALAAPKLSDEQRREIGSLLIDRLVRAGRDAADVSMDALQAAAGTMGPVILPAILDAIAEEPDTCGAWFHLWGLTLLAGESQDDSLRDRVLQACVDLLERADRGEVSLPSATRAAWTLASFKHTEHADLLRRLSERPVKDWWVGEYGEALKLLEGHIETVPYMETWEEPVEEWLGEMIEEEAAEQDSYGEEPDEDEADVSPFEEYARLLTSVFLTSHVAGGLPGELLSEARPVVRDLVDLSLKHLAMKPRDWDEAALRELLLVLVPRYVPADQRLLRQIVPIAEAFLYWLGMEGLLTDANTLAMTVHDWSDQIVAAGMDRKNWGPIKTFLMEAREAGIDATYKDKLKAFLNRQVAETFEAVEHFSEPPAPGRREPPIPIVEQASRPARNAPCPCGSGKKYKKCHDRADAKQMSDE